VSTLLPLQNLPNLTTAYWCTILGSKPTDSIQAMKQQFKKMCLLMHPDKIPSVAADGAFKLVFNAWEALSSLSGQQLKCF